MSAMDDYLASKKAPTVLLGAVERHLLTRPPEERRTDVLHPSEMCKLDWCIREAWFLLNGWEKPRETVNLRLSSIFAEGHYIHAKWQRWLTEMGVLKGVWKCRTHDAEWWGMRTDNPLHVYCANVEYREVPIINQKYRIAGHADGWLVLDEQYLLEAKSIGTGTIRVAGGTLAKGGLEESFRLIKRPFRDHVRQVMLYLWCLRQTYDDAPSKALILYECKANQAAKEFVVAYHEEWIEDVLEKLDLLDIDSPAPPPCSNGDDCSKCRRYV